MENNKELVKLLNQISKLLEGEEERYIALLDKLKNAINPKSIAHEAETLAKNLIEERYGKLPEITKIQIGDNKPKEIKGLTHSAFQSILTLLANGENVLLNGPSGTGKNVLGNQIAEAFGLEFYCTPAIRQEYKLSGFIDANGKFVETPFYKAWTKGGVYLFDEMDASDPTVILNINSALANGYYEFPIGLIKKHKDFYILGAGNTLGNGGDRVYTARDEMDASTIDRFAVVPFGYDEKLERELAGNNNIYEFVTAVRKAVEDTGLRYVVSMRATKSLAQLYGKMDIQELVKYVVCKNMRPTDIKTVVQNCKCPSNNPLFAALKAIAK